MSILLPLISSKKLINQINLLINSNLSFFTSNQSNFSTISKNSCNDMKVFKINQSNFLIKI